MNNPKNKIKIGDRIVLIEMPNDPDPVKPGSTGTVIDVTDFNIMVKWDNINRSLALIPKLDKFEIISNNNSNQATTVSQKVYQGLLAVRDSGRTNMFDIPAVARIAIEMGYYQTAVWIVDPLNKKQYVEGVLYGFIPESSE